jgi:hypothetical protein
MSVKGLARIRANLYMLYISLATDLPLSQAKDRSMRLTKDACVRALGYNKIAK